MCVHMHTYETQCPCVKISAQLDSSSCGVSTQSQFRLARQQNIIKMTLPKKQLHLNHFYLPSHSLCHLVLFIPPLLSNVSTPSTSVSQWYGVRANYTGLWFSLFSPVCQLQPIQTLLKDSLCGFLPGLKKERTTTPLIVLVTSPFPIQHTDFYAVVFWSFLEVTLSNWGLRCQWK